jgi:hypothetical protein
MTRHPLARWIWVRDFTRTTRGLRWVYHRLVYPLWCRAWKAHCTRTLAEAEGK